MDVKPGKQNENDAEDYYTKTSSMNIDGSMHEYNAMHRQMQMHKTFTLETNTDFLIEGIDILSIQGIVLAVIFSFAITILLDIMKFIMLVQELQKGKYMNTQVQKRKHTLGLLVTAISHMLSVSVAYIMMLCVMTMNVWLMVSVILGSGFAHFIVRPVLSLRQKRQPEHFKDVDTEHSTGEVEPLDHIDHPGNKYRSKSNTKMVSVRRSLLIEDSTNV